MPNRRGLAALLFALLLPGTVLAGDLATPDGAVVLTVTGNIENTNRGAFDPGADLFFKYHEKSFAKAAAFDRAMLEKLGLHKATIAVAGVVQPVEVEGPRLSDLLAAVGAKGETVTVMALDGYASEIAWADVEALDWIVGLKQNGEDLALGRRGPLWVVYTYPDGRALTEEDELRWPWAAFYIEIN